MADDTTASTTPTTGKTATKPATPPASSSPPPAAAPDPVRAAYAAQFVAGILAYHGTHTSIPHAVDHAIKAADTLIAQLAVTAGA